MIRSLSVLVSRQATLVCLLLCAAPSALAQQTLPDRLDDRDFRDLIVSLSEPGGSFADENFVSNELGLQRLLPELQSVFRPGGVYIGVGPEQNFSYIASLRPGIAFIVDIRRQNMLEHLLYKALFETSADRIQFLSALFSRAGPTGLGPASGIDALLRAYRVTPAEQSRLTDTQASVLEHLERAHGFELSDGDQAVIGKILRAFFESGPAIAYTFGESDDWHPNFIQLMEMRDATGTNWSFLGSEQNYRLVRQLQLDNRIVPVVGDFAGPRTLRSIGRYLRDRGMNLDVFYVSNVESYLFADGLSADFYANLATLPITNDSILIRTFFGSAARACRARDVTLRAPLQASIRLLLTEYRNGEIRSVCDLLERSR